jgi:tetrahydromethanopterin S-methyltransferase subunit E
MVDSNLKVGLRQPYPGMMMFFLWGILISMLESSKSHKKV